MYGFPDKYFAWFSRQFDWKSIVPNVTNWRKFSIELDPNDAMAYYNRGVSKLRLGQRDSACRDLSKASELGDEDAFDRIRKHCD